jgi:predicted GH43/DUF377 family glycosyl hydrolase
MKADQPFSNTKNFKTQELVPESWLNGSRGDDFYAFNPAITVFRGERLMAYRVVGPDRRRRLAVCRLDARWNVKPGSLVPLSDHLLEAGDWHADPRFCVFEDRLLMHFNDGFRRPNRISLVELDPDALIPKGPARPLLLDVLRRDIEKNWLLFDYEGMLLAVYTISPHVILRVFPDDRREVVPCARIYENVWDSSAYSSRFGVLRGGTPPLRVGESYFSFFHSVYRVSFRRRVFNRLIHGQGTRTYRCAMGFYGFSASPPFGLQNFTPTPVLFPPRSNATVANQLNRKIDRTIYPCGSVFLDNLWAVSFGINDASCRIRLFSHEALAGRSLDIPAPSRKERQIGMP